MHSRVGHSPSGRADRPRGQILIIAAIGFTVFLGVAALAVDFGTYLVTQRYLQNAADGAALAGATELGDPDVSPADAATKAAEQAARYLDENLKLGLSAADRSAVAATMNSANGYCYPDPANCNSARYQFWIYSPTPPTTAHVTTGIPGGNPLVYVNPQKYPARTRAIFVRVDEPGRSFFGRIFGITPPVIPTQAIATPTGKRCAVAALKPRLGSPDNDLGITLNSAQIRVARGDVCSNYSIDWAGSGAQVVFTAGNGQVVYLAEPGAMQGTESVVNGTVDTLTDPVEDPHYTYAVPGSSPTVHRPPAAAFPSCVNTADRANGIVSCTASGWATVPSSFTLYPGKYQLIDIPDGKNVTLSRDCYSGDPCRTGVYWTSLDTCGTGPIHKGGIWLKGTSSSSSLSGQGVLLIFDPCEDTPYSVTFDVSSNSANLHLNDSPDMMTTAHPTGTIPFVWYNPSDNDPLNDPVSVWVRPNYATGGSTYNMTDNPGSGSNVISFTALPLISENGLIYAPEDNSIISGNGLASGVGQVVSWTITYSGSGSSLTQDFAGGSTSRARLVQ